MPLEIKELNVKVSVNQPKTDGGQGSSSRPEESDESRKSGPENLSKDIVEQMLEIIKNQKER